MFRLGTVDGKRLAGYREEGGSLLICIRRSIAGCGAFVADGGAGECGGDPGVDAGAEAAGK